MNMNEYECIRNTLFFASNRKLEKISHFVPRHIFVLTILNIPREVGVKMRLRMPADALNIVGSPLPLSDSH